MATLLERLMGSTIILHKLAVGNLINDDYRGDQTSELYDKPLPKNKTHPKKSTIQR
jgi:hypothetical protein